MVGGSVCVCGDKVTADSSGWAAYRAAGSRSALATLALVTLTLVASLEPKLLPRLTAAGGGVIRRDKRAWG